MKHDLISPGGKTKNGIVCVEVVYQFHETIENQRARGVQAS